ncbi:MAG: hypothetical protein U9P14_11185 [Gemmatimonadota bacterium]|nr:hypothetical protein [Gemmatimonadota bacterium]
MTMDYPAESNLSTEEDFRLGVKTICHGHMALKPGETILIVADPPMKELGRQMAAAAVSSGFEARLLEIGPVEKAGHAPLEFTAGALAATGAALLVTSKSLSHTEPRRTACYEKGVRIASMPGIRKGMICRLFRPGMPEVIARRTSELASRLEGAGRIVVSTGQSTQFELELTGREIFMDTGLYHDPGRFGNLPAGEVCASPVSGTCRGRAVVDVAFAGLGAVEGLVLEIEDGRLVGAQGPDSERVLGLLDRPECRVVAEFGIGTNPVAELSPLTLEAEKAVGTIHLGFGDSRSFGGGNAAIGHWDAVIRCRSIEVDGKALTLERVEK